MKSIIDEKSKKIEKIEFELGTVKCRLLSLIEPVL
jgi:hypothetical protein